MRVKIASNWVGNGAPCFIVAEAGVNHNGKLNLAKKLVDAAKKAGADAVKFQVFRAENVVTKKAEKAEYQKKSTGTGSQYEMLRRLELTQGEFRELAAHARRKNIIFLASAFDAESVDFLNELKVPAFKIPSGEITNFPLLGHIARKRKPIMLSTGMSTLKEVAGAVSVLVHNGAREIILLHCVSDYPARVEDINLRAMDTLKRKFKLPVGLSDHTLGITVPMAAVVLGASVIEKHFTLDQKMPGPDHRASLEPSELRRMVTCIREAEKALGNGIKRPTRGEEAIKKAVRRHIVAKVDIPKGKVIRLEMLGLKRAGAGLGSEYIEKIIGKRAKRNIMKDDLIFLEKIV